MPSDDAVRQALLRMGSGRPKSDTAQQRKPGNANHQSHNQGAHHGHNGQRRGSEPSQQSASPDARRRRFSQNEHVPVEYVSRDRPARNAPGEALRLDLGRVELAEPGDDRIGFLERELVREREARAAAERVVEENRVAMTALRTRIAHLDIDLQEARAQRQALLDLAQSAAQQTAEARAAAARPAEELDPSGQPVRRGRGRPRRVAVPAELDEESEPEPVKWWVD